MSVKGLQRRDIIGTFYKTLNAGSGAQWTAPISMFFNSDQDSETYKWIGQSPVMQEWVSGRNVKTMRETGIDVVNKHFEATIEVKVRDLRRDKSSQVRIRIADLARRTNSHWASLLSTLVIDGEASLCYDGQYFFDTDHVEGLNVTAQSNDITTDISALPTVVHGTPSAPSPEEAQQAIIKSIAQMLGFRDDVNEPMNEDASSFLVMVPINLYIPFANSINMPRAAGVSVQDLAAGLSVDVVMNPRLTATDKFYTFRTDGDVKALIRQEETPVQLLIVGEGSEYEFKNDAHQYGVDTWRNVQYGYWQNAVLNQLI